MMSKDSVSVSVTLKPLLIAITERFALKVNLSKEARSFFFCLNNLAVLFLCRATKSEVRVYCYCDVSNPKLRRLKPANHEHP